MNWEVVFNRYEKRLLEAKTTEEFARVTGFLLATAKDYHIRVHCEETPIPVYFRPVEKNINFDLLSKLVPDFTKKSEICYTGRYPDGIGYLCVTTWNIKNEDELIPIHAALQELLDTHSLVLDVRLNPGGTESMGMKVAGCFVDKETLYAKHQYVNLKESEGNLGETRERWFSPNENAPKYRGQVVVLIGEKVKSSCESFVMMMMQVPKCVTVGEFTGGGQGIPELMSWVTALQYTYHHGGLCYRTEDLCCAKIDRAA